MYLHNTKNIIFNWGFDSLVLSGENEKYKKMNLRTISNLSGPGGRNIANSIRLDGNISTRQKNIVSNYAYRVNQFVYFVSLLQKRICLIPIN